MSNFSIFSCYFIVLHTLNFLSPMLSFINNNNFSFFGFSSLSFFVFVFTTLKKKYLFLKIVSIDLILFQVKALYYHRKCFVTMKSIQETVPIQIEAFKWNGGRYSIFLGRGENLIWGTLHFIGGLDNHLETMLYYLSL